MAQKAMVDGTVYELSGGKTMVDGTAYTIHGGKTMVDGTVYEISMVQNITVKIQIRVDTEYGGDFSGTGLTLTIAGKSYAIPPSNATTENLATGFTQKTFTISVPTGSSLYVTASHTNIYGSYYGGVYLNSKYVNNYSHTMTLSDNAYISVTCVTGEFSYRTVSITHPYAS